MYADRNVEKRWKSPPIRWASLKMVERYSHLSPSHRAEAIERIAAENFTTAFHNTD